MKISLGVKLIHPPGVLIISIFLFALSVFLIGQNLDKPFWGEHDWNGARYGNIARNYLRYGFLETKFGQVENSGPAKPEEFEYYTHYLPLLPILISLSYRIFGISKWSTRLIPMLTTSGSLVLIFLIGNKFWSLRVGVVATLLALVSPIVLYFAKNPVHEPVTLFFVLLSFWGYLERRKLIFLLGLIFAQITAWAGYFLIPALILTFILRKDFNEVKNLAPYWILSIAIFTFHLLHINLLTGSISGGHLFESLLQRSGLASNIQPSHFSLPGYLNQLRLWFSTLFTITLVLLATFWLVVKRFDIKNGWPIFTLGFIGAIYTILFSSSVFIHNYLIFYFLPLLTLAGALGIEALLNYGFFKKIYLVLIALFVLLIFFERKSFVDALNGSSSDRFAVEVGKAINKQTKQQDTVLVSPLKFSYSADKFLRFYGDRKLIYSEDSGDYDVKVVVDQENGKFEIIPKETR